MSFQFTKLQRILTAEVLDTTPANTRAAFSTEGYDQVTLLFAYTWAAASRVDAVVEVSWDGTTWFRLVNVAISGGTSALALEDNQYTTGGASANLARNYDCNWPWMRVSIDATAATTDVVTVDVILGRLGD